MSKIQKISFKNYDEFIESITPDERQIVEILRAIIFESIPDCKEKLSYNVPYYWRFSRICFIWPASIPWGGIEDGVAIGFCRGDELADLSYLEKQDRKKVYRKVFTNKKQVDVELLKACLYEAVIIDEGCKNKKQT